MPYIGRDLNRGNYLKLDDISSSFNSQTKTFELKVGGSAFTPGSAFSILVSVGGVIQEPESAYQVNNSEITFANAPTAQDGFFCLALGVPIGIGVPGNGTVNGTQMAKPFNYDGYFYLDDTNNRVGIGSLAPTQALDVSGTIKASSFIGPIVGNTNNSSGLSTFYDLRVSNNLTVEGTTTTLDTNLIGVDRIEVGADSNTTVGVAITQSGTADIFNLYDGSTEVFSVADGGDTTMTGNLTISNTAPRIILNDTDTDSDFRIQVASGNFRIQDVTNGNANRLSINSGGTATFTSNVNIDGNITSGGEIKTLTLFESTSGNDLRLNAGSANRDIFLQVNDTTLMTVRGSTGSVGIGTNNPLNRLDVYGSSASAAVVDSAAYSNGSNGGLLSLQGLDSASSRRAFADVTGLSNGANAGDFRIRTRKSGTMTETLRINKDGQVVINRPSGAVRAASASKLEVFNDTYNTIYVSNSTAATNQEAGIMFAPANNTYGGQIVVKSDEDFSTSANRTSHMAFYTRHNGTADERLRISSDGKVGIGETSPSSKFEIVSGNAASVVSGIKLKNDSTSASGPGSSIDFVVDGVNDVTTAQIIGQRTSANYHQGSLQFLTRDSGGAGLVERLRIHSSGQTSIGTTTLGHSSADDLTINNSGNGGITIRTGTTSNGAIFFADSTSGDARFDGFVQYNHGTNPYMIFGTATDEKFRITDTGLLQAKSHQHDGGIELLSSNNNQSTRIRLQAKSSGGTSYDWYLDSARGADRFTINDGTTSWFTILGSGNVGINSIAPQSKLELDGRFRILDNSDGTPSTGKGLEISYYTSDDMADILSYDRGGSSYKKLQLRGSSIELKKNNSAKIIVGTGGNGTAVGFSTTTCLVTNAEAISVRGYSSFKSPNKSYAAIYLASEGNTNDTANQLLMFNAGGANRGGFGYVPNTGELRFNHQYFMTFCTGSQLMGGTERLRITATGRIEVKGSRAGDLQANDDDTLKLYTKSTTDDINRGVGITFYTHDGSGYEMGGTIQVAKENGTTNDAKSYMRFSTQTGSTTSEALRIASDGKISQGGHAPSYEYDLRGSGIQSILIGSTNAAGAMLILDGDSNGDGAGVDYGSIAHKSDGNIEINNRKSGSIIFKNTSSESERFRIDSDGIVAVNPSNDTSSSVFKICKDGNGEAQLRFETASANTASIVLDSSEQLKFKYGGTEVFRIDSAGRIQIGSSINTSYNSFDGPGRLNIQNNQPDGTVDFGEGIVFTDNTNNAGTWTHAGIVCTGSSGYNGNLIFGTDGDGTQNNPASNITERMRVTANGGTVVSKSGTPNAASGWAGLEVKASSTEHQLVLSSSATASNSNQARLGFKLHPSNDNERVKAAIVCQGSGGGYGEVSRMMFCLDGIADNGNALPNSSSDERVRITQNGAFHINSTSNGHAMIAFGNPDGHGFRENNKIGGTTVVVGDESISSAIYMPRDGAMVVITAFSEGSDNDGNYPQPNSSGIVYVDCGPSRNIVPLSTGSVGADIVGKGTYTSTVSDCDAGKLTVMAGNTEGTFRLVNRTDNNTYRYQVTFL